MRENLFVDGNVGVFEVMGVVFTQGENQLRCFAMYRLCGGGERDIGDSDTLMKRVTVVGLKNLPAWVELSR